MSRIGRERRKIEEDEYCLIPMGGVLPRVPQRVLGIGGTAGMVHPSTGTKAHLQLPQLLMTELPVSCQT